MSYVRMGPDSDVYVFHNGKEFECYGASKHHTKRAYTNGEIVEVFKTPDLALLIAHLHGHRLEGQKVPARCFANLLEELVKGTDDGFTD